MHSNKLNTWKELNTQYNNVHNTTINEFFAQEPDRLKNFTFEIDELYVDFSLNRISKHIKELLIQLAIDAELPKKITELFAGEKVNFTENRAALHTLLRAPDTNSVNVPSDVFTKIIAERTRMFDFAKKIQTGELCGSTGKKINTIITVGVGGSGLGPQLLNHALNHQDFFNLHFVSGMDGEEIDRLLNKINPETSLFIIVSKSFNTIDTLSNANTIKDWLMENKCNYKKHLVGVTENKEAVYEFGIDEHYYFHIPTEVGGRYSLWSSVSLAIVIAIGQKEFNEFLSGGHLIDLHFRNQKLSANVPVLLALLDIWYLNFFKWQTRAILPYSSLLQEFPSYLQQLEMESCGKQVDHTLQQVHYDTGPIIWGDVGFLGQHSFYQLLHQGTLTIPVDIILPLHSNNQLTHHKNLALINALAQIETLVHGFQGEKEYQKNPGNKPVTVMIFPKITAKICGMLIALYEHKVYAKSVIWGIDPFDQWGVEAGKKLAKQYQKNLENSVSLSMQHIFSRVKALLSK